MPELPEPGLEERAQKAAEEEKDGGVVEMAKTYQVNNLKIVYSKTYNKWQVRTLKGVTLEESRLLADAKKWASKTHDFVQR